MKPLFTGDVRSNLDAETKVAPLGISMERSLSVEVRTRALAPGALVADRFEIERLAGEGGMGMVYRARDRAGGEIVALKLLHTEARADKARFEREAQILADLRHPGVVRYVAHGETAGGEPFLAMEWLEGEDLADRLAREGLSIAESIQVVASAASALAAAHRRGVVHRDIKPSNLFLPGRALDRVMVLDFGIARAAYQGTSITRTGITIGTPAYMSPEQARGDAGVDPRSDVFSLGCVLFECVVGRSPFVGEHFVAVLAKILVDEPPRLGLLVPETPPALDDLVARMLAKKPSDRPSDGDAVVRALSEIEAPSGHERRPRTVPPPEIGAGEQRLLSVVLAGRSSESDLDDATIASIDPAAPLSIHTEAMRFGARLELLADGTTIATLAGEGAATDQAARAARCAIALQRTSPKAPIAIATGRGVVANGWPLGDVIDRAVRRLRAQRGALDRAPSIGLDEVTAGLLDARFEVSGDDRGLLLLGERAGTEPIRTLLGKPTPCVGRDREIGALMDIFNECVDEPGARAVLVTSAAGMGKSRLRFELIRRVRAMDRPVGIMIGRGDPMSAGSPFALLAGALRSALGVVDGEPDHVRRQKLRARVGRHVPAADGLHVAEIIGEVVGLPFPDDESPKLRAARQDPTLMGDQIHFACEDLFAAECEVSPLLLVLEDLHWGDLPSLSVVEGILRRLSAAPMMVLGLGRPELHRAFPKLWEERSVTEIRLGEISRKAASSLAREALGEGARDETIARIVDRAAGNAFYLEELIRSVAEGGTGELPETVLAMAQARLEALEPEARRVLRAASVFGQTFRRAGVSALLGGSHQTSKIMDWLPELVRRELITRRPGGALGDEVFAFRHALIRDAAYASLTEQDRVLGHKLAGEHLARSGDRDALALAEHFDRGGLPDRARVYVRVAAEHALEGHDFSAALDRVARAVRSGASGSELGALRLVEAEARRWSGDFTGAEESAKEAMGLLPRGSAAWHRAADEAMIAGGRRGDYTEAEAMARSLDVHPIDEDARSARAICLCSAARQLFHAARYDLADAILAHVGARLEGLDPRAVAEVHRLAGGRARHNGDPTGDVAGYAAALAAFETAGDARSACNCRVSLGFGYIELGDFEAARVELERAALSAERMGLSIVLRRARQNLCLVLAHAGALDEAAAAALFAIEGAIAQGDRLFEGWTRIYLSRVRLLAGDAVEALREAGTAVERLASAPPARAGARAAEAQALLAAGDVEGALAAAREAYEALVVLGSVEEFEPMIRLVHAEALHASGDAASALAAIGAAETRIVEQAAAIVDASRRERFLREVPDNARILERARTWRPSA